MPTSRPRHLITETNEVAQALDDAAKRWPADKHRRSRLVLRLLAEGHRVVRADREKAGARRSERVRATAGALTGAYGTDYLHELREDWPA
ncbi:MAG: hypothetical protein ACR2MY_14635 [Candidatus Dormibacteria bacterium]